MSIAEIAAYEELCFQIQMAEFDKDKHLKRREKQYVEIGIKTPGAIIVVRETEDGWWRESYDFSNNPEKQIEKLKNDPTVACGWYSTARFNEPGGWYDPS